MALPLILGAGMGILGAKNAQDQKKDMRLASDRDALLASGQTAYSGLTGAGPGKLAAQEAGPSVMGNALAGGVSGFSQGQAFNQSAMQDKVNNAYASLLEKQGGGMETPMAGAPVQNPYTPIARGRLGLTAPLMPPERG